MNSSGLAGTFEDQGGLNEPTMIGGRHCWRLLKRVLAASVFSVVVVFVVVSFYQRTESRKIDLVKVDMPF